MSEDEAVFEAVRALAEAGEYLDSIPGIAQPPTASGGPYAITPAGRYRRLYERRSPEYLQARRDGLVEPLPPLVPATAEAVAAAEDTIGFALPPLLRRLYLEVGDGGFGPGYGLLGLSDGHSEGGHGAGNTALGLYRREHEGPARQPCLAPGLLPICSWGCGIYSFVDCSQPQGPMWGLDPNPVSSDEDALYAQGFNLAGWLGRWIDGPLYQPWVVEDPVTGEWRGATDEEYAECFAEMEDAG
jgi:SMI1 / KNR4 family (SUKH-1)